MMVRLAALALNAHQLQDLCRGDGVLAFGAGLSDPDDPDGRAAGRDGSDGRGGSGGTAPA